MSTAVSEKRLYLEDLAVGDEFVSREHLLDAAQIIAFASQFDPQYYHLDAEAAKDSFFEGLAASGWHTAAITMRLLTESVPVATGLIGAGGEINWPRPTRPGEALHVKTRILDIKPSRSKPDRGIVTIQSLTFNQDGELRQDYTGKLLVFTRESQESAG